MPGSEIDCAEKAAEWFEAAGSHTVTGMDAALVSECNAVVIPGGLPDVDPSYWRENNTGCKVIDTELDRKQMAVIETAVAQKKPIFGICRGMQLVSVWFGATMIQDIKSGESHRYDPKAVKAHKVLSVPGSFAQQLYGSSVTVNSAHHQALRTIPIELRAAQLWCADEGRASGLLSSASLGQLREFDSGCIAETVYHESYPFIGTQWHPELCGVWPGSKADAMVLADYFLRLIKE